MVAAAATECERTCRPRSRSAFVAFPVQARLSLQSPTTRSSHQNLHGTLKFVGALTL